jgi:hypothetical protein
VRTNLKKENKDEERKKRNHPAVNHSTLKV